MANTYTFIRGVYAGGETLSQRTDITSGSAISIDEAIPANQTDLAVAFAFTKAKLQGIYIESAVAMTLETNSSSSPQETISLVANVPFIWVTDGYITNPFGGNVTALYVTNTTAGTLKIRAIVDPT